METLATLGTPIYIESQGVKFISWKQTFNLIESAVSPLVRRFFLFYASSLVLYRSYNDTDSPPDPPSQHSPSSTEN